MTDLERFNEWLGNITESFDLDLNGLVFTFKKEPTLGDFAKVMNYEKKGDQMLMLIYRLLMKPVISFKRLQAIKGRYLEKLFVGITENIDIPKGVLNDDVVRSRDDSKNNDSLDEGITSPSE